MRPTDPCRPHPVQTLTKLAFRLNPENWNSPYKTSKKQPPCSYQGPFPATEEAPPAHHDGQFGLNVWKYQIYLNRDSLRLINDARGSWFVVWQECHLGSPTISLSDA